MTSKRNAEEIARLERLFNREVEQHSETRQKLQEAKELIRHYETALSAVKWLWDQALSQRPFQM